jgi:DNA-directed RNA polymerase subunit H (RpoH/RPB5)
VLKHHLVPKHEVLTPAEKKELLATLECKASALPKVRSSDPVIKYMGYPVGCIVRIHRSIGTMEKEIYYRYVVP